MSDSTSRTDQPPGAPLVRAVGVCRLGRFVLEGELGRGAFGVVYRARDPQLDRIVALKIPHLDSTQAKSHARRFLREAKAAAGLHHPNIVAVHDAGQIDDTLYIAAAFIDGCTLRELLAKQERPASRVAARLIASLADALAYAHDNNVVHRDVKPENVLMSRDGVPYLTDFGLALRGTEDVLRTVEGFITGTPAYMSPEQTRAGDARIDGQSDQWSLGVLLYELLTGQRPFAGNQIQLLYAIQHTTITPPSELEHAVPEHLATICMRMLSRAPLQRYPNCHEVHDDLVRWLNDEPILARPESAVERLHRWSRKNPATALLSLALLAFMCLFTVTAAVLGWRAEVARQAEQRKAEELQTTNLTLEATNLTLETRNTELHAANERIEQGEQELAVKHSHLMSANQQLGVSSQEINRSAQVIEQTVAEKLQAEKLAEKEAERRRNEESRNLRLKYFGSIQSAKLALAGGKTQAGVEILSQIDPANRACEWDYLWRAMHRRQTPELISDLRHLPALSLRFYSSLHTPQFDLAQSQVTALSSHSSVVDIDNSGLLVLTETDGGNWLLTQLPALGLPTYKPRTSVDPINSYPPLARLQVNQVIRQHRLFEESAVTGWLSKTAGKLIYVRPRLSRQTRTEGLQYPEHDLTLHFDLLLRDVTETNAVDVMLKTWTAGSIHLANRSQQVVTRNRNEQGVLSPTVDSQNHCICLKSELPSTWPKVFGAFSQDAGRFAFWSDGQLECYDFNASVTEPYSRRLLANLSCKSQSRPLAWLNESVAVITDTGVEAFTAGALEEITASRFNRGLNETSQVFFSDSQRVVCVLEDGKQDCHIEIFEIDGGVPLLSADFTHPTAQSFNLFAEARLKAAAAGIPILDWHSPRLVDAIDGSWYCLKTSASRDLPPPTLHDDKRIVLWRKLASGNVVEPQLGCDRAHSLGTSMRFAKGSTAGSVMLFSKDRLAYLQPQVSGKYKRVYEQRVKGKGIVDTVVIGAQNLCAHLDGESLRWSQLSDGQMLPNYSLPAPLGRALQCANDEKTMLISSADGQLASLAIGSNQITRTQRVLRDGAAAAVADRHLHWLVTGGDALALSRWNFLSTQPSGTQDVEAPVRNLVLSEDHDVLCATLEDESIGVWRWSTFQRRFRFVPRDETTCMAAAITKDRLLLVTRQRATLIDLEEGTEVIELARFASPIEDALLVESPLKLLTIDSQAVLSIFDLQPEASPAGVDMNDN